VFFEQISPIRAPRRAIASSVRHISAVARAGGAATGESPSNK
jgi:hypothetical protein